MCDYKFICTVPKEWPFTSVSVTKNLIVKEYEQLKLKRKDRTALDADGTALDADYYLLHGNPYKLYAVFENIVQCSWQCNPSSQYKQHVKESGESKDSESNEVKESETIEQQFCLEGYEWWNNSRIIGRMTEWPQSLYGKYIFNKRFDFDIAPEKIKEPTIKSLQLI